MMNIIVECKVIGTFDDCHYFEHIPYLTNITIRKMSDTESSPQENEMVENPPRTEAIPIASM